MHPTGPATSIPASVSAIARPTDTKYAIRPSSLYSRAGAWFQAFHRDHHTVDSSDLISTWDDLTDAALDATAATTDRPTQLVGTEAEIRADIIPTDRLVSGNTTDYQYMYDGSGGTLYAVVEVDSHTPGQVEAIATNWDAQPTDNGIGLFTFFDGANRKYRIIWGNGPTLVSLLDTPGSLVTLGQRQLVTVVTGGSINGNGNAAQIWVNNVFRVGGTAGATPSTNAATYSMTIGHRADGTPAAADFDGKIDALLFLPFVPSKAENDEIVNSLNAYYRIF